MGLLLVGALALQPALPAATCRSVGLEPQRTWRFDKPGNVWQVTHWRGATRTGEVRLSLPANATVLLATDSVAITARTSNGGIDVALGGTPARAQLDIYVSYELEVNVDASLTPAIDEIGTDGPIGVTCVVPMTPQAALGARVLPHDEKAGSAVAGLPGTHGHGDADMINRRELIGSMAATALAGTASSAIAAQATAAGKGLRVAQGSRWVAIGDSITDAGRSKPMGEAPNGLGTGYVLTMDALLQAWYPARRIRLFNVGTSGHTVRDLKARWQTDVTDLQPDWLSVLVGANDVWRQFDRVTQPERSVLPAEYEQTYDQLLTMTAPMLKGGLVLITPFFLEPRADDPMRARMDEYGAIVKRLAVKHTAVLVDSQAAFNVVLKDLPSAMINWDRVHLNHIGAAVLARAVLNAVGFEWR